MLIVMTTPQYGSSPLARGAPHRHTWRHGPGGLIPARAGSTRTGRGLTRCRPAHPRSRGEHTELTIEPQQSGGSSPLARGAPTTSSGLIGPLRLIPARAGSTLCPAGGGGHCAAHPRSRGEHVIPGDDSRDGVGLIPAPAGSTATCPGRGTSFRAHPRSRGEHHAPPRPRVVGAGSSPLARGARAPGGHADRSRRLIPARAGSTRASSSSRPRARAHPRSRGEHVDRPDDDVLADGLIPARAGSTAHCSGLSTGSGGSSPLARGARCRGRCRHRRRGLIPARAGSTYRRRRLRSTAAAHPRSRGEHAWVPNSLTAVAGSSPLARGARRQRLGAGAADGLIPARAGSTGPPRPPQRPRRAHPRSRGEHPSGVEPTTATRGSSPLARGAPLRGVRRRR